MKAGGFELRFSHFPFFSFLSQKKLSTQRVIQLADGSKKKKEIFLRVIMIIMIILFN
jgi:hypothetical protein